MIPISNRLTPDLVQWVPVLASVVLTLVIGPLTGLASPRTLFLLAVPFLLLHGVRQYGWRALMVFVLASLIISNIYENWSILTGFPFGHYRYTGGPKLFLVPLEIGPFYAVIGYRSWQTANVLLGWADARLNRSSTLVLLPVVSAALMTMYDLTTDPIASTLEEEWIWRDGGGFFGVPASNFLGWWLCTYSFFQVFAFYLRRSREQIAPRRAWSFWLQPIILYFNLGFVAVVRFLAAAPDSHAVRSMNGVSWRPQDIHEATMTVFLFTMGVVSLLAIGRLFDRVDREIQECDSDAAREIAERSEAGS
jgi:uncharacterized membrane protein